MRAIASNALSIAVVRGAPVGCRVLLLLALARVSSSEELARVSYAIAVAEGLKFVADGGMDVWAVRAIGLAASSEEVSRVTSTMALAKLSFGCAGGLIAAAIAYFTGHGGLLLPALSGVFVVAGEVFGVGVIYHLARSTLGRLVPIALAAAGLTMAASLAALAMGVDSVLVCAIIAGAEALTAAVVVARLRAARVIVAFPGIVANCRAAVRLALPTTTYSAVTAMYSRLDAIALNAFSSMAFGTYTVAFRAQQPFMFVFGAVSLAAYTAYVSRAGVEFRLRKLLAYIFAMASLAAIAAYFACAWLIVNFIPVYADSLATLRVLCALLPLLSVNMISTYVLIGKGRSTAVLSISVINLLSTTVLLWLLVPLLGALGAALSLLGCQLVNSLVLIRYMTRPGLEPVPA